jgi:superfamily II DNA/RNA helicase
VHRIGRTARAARKGEAITLVSPEDGFKFKKIEKLIDKEVPKLALPASIGAAPTEGSTLRSREPRRPAYRKDGAKTGEQKRENKSSKPRWRDKPKPKQEG